VSIVDDVIMVGSIASKAYLLLYLSIYFYYFNNQVDPDCLLYNTSLIYWLFGQLKVYFPSRHHIFTSAPRKALVCVSWNIYLLLSS